MVSSINIHVNVEWNINFDFYNAAIKIWWDTEINKGKTFFKKIQSNIFLLKYWFRTIWSVIISDYHFVEILICPLLLECTKLIFNSSKCTKMFWCQLHEVGRMTTD